MAPNDFTNGTANKSQAKPFTDESSHSEPRIVTAVQARQGVISGRVVLILGASISLALLAMILAYLAAF
jgi:hypothetical protein